MTTSNEAPMVLVPSGYALVAESVLRAWGKLDEVRAACVFPIALAQGTAMTPPERLQDVTLAERLLPCRFCDSERVQVTHVRDGLRVSCGACLAEGPPMFYGPEDRSVTRAAAIVAWNRREAAAALSVRGDVWMPIDSIPKDESRVELLSANGKTDFGNWYALSEPSADIQDHLNTDNGEGNYTHWRKSATPPSEG